MAEKKAEKPGKDEADSAKKKPPILIIGAVIALVALAGVFFVGKQVSAKGKAGAVQHVEKGPVLVLDEFLVNLSDSSGDHFLKATVGLELDKDKGKTPESLKEQIAPIRDAVLSSLSSKTRDQVSPLPGREKLKAEIKKKVNESLGEDDVRSVYFTNFVTQ